MIRFRLELLTGEQRETIFEGEARAPVLLGRRATNAVVLADKTVSREHATIEETGGGLRLKDGVAGPGGGWLRSQNGTWRGTESVNEAGITLRDGDEVRFGQAKLRVSILAVPPPEAGADRPERRPPEGTPVASTSPEEKIVDTFGPYGIVRTVDTAGAGEVHLAVDSRSRARVALKRFPASSFGFFGTGKFLRACEAARPLAHENVIAPRDSGKEGKAVYVVFPWVPGISVERILRELPKELTLPLAVHIAREVSRGLAYLEEAKVVRPEVTDQSVLVTAEGRAVLLGAGVPSVGDRKQGPGARFQAPEEDGGSKGDARSAIFSLGILLYEMLTGERVDPAKKNRLQPVDNIRIAVSPSLGQATMRALRVKPETRYDSAAELEADLADELAQIASSYGAEDVKRWMARRYPECTQ